jgi:hypothetical protein
MPRLQLKLDVDFVGWPRWVVRQLAERLRPELESMLARNDSRPGEEYSPDHHQAARRAAKNAALSFLSALELPEIRAVRWLHGAAVTRIAPAAIFVAMDHDFFYLLSSDTAQRTCQIALRAL